MDAQTALQVSMAQAHIKSVPELSKRTGIKQTTLYTRIKNPSTLTVAELAQIARTCHMSRDLIAAIVEGGGR